MSIFTFPGPGVDDAIASLTEFEARDEPIRILERPLAGLPGRALGGP